MGSSLLFFWIMASLKFTLHKEREAARTSTTTTTTRRPRNKGRKNKNKEGNGNDNLKKSGERSARLIPGLKIQGMNTALEQVVKYDKH